MNAEIITIGDELLIGQVIDTNSAWMAEQLNRIDVEVLRITTVRDRADEMIRAFDSAFRIADIVLVTGGLGPTGDDITKQTLCRYFGGKLIRDESVMNTIREVFRKKGLAMNDLTANQAWVPDCCTVIQNPVGTAPVMWFGKGPKVLVSMPGVPSEMKDTMVREILPRIQARFSDRHTIRHFTCLVKGYTESALAMRLADFEQRLPENVRLAYLPTPGIIRLRLTVRGSEGDPAALLETQAVSLQRILGSAVFCTEDLSPAGALGRLLEKKGLTLATAESCTGGNIAHEITLVAGSSAYFKGSVVAYANEVKEEVLGVNGADIAREGAVSRIVACQMAEGVARLMRTDCAIATTGIAGPGGGSPEKPVGTVWIAVRQGARQEVRRLVINGSREQNIARFTQSAILMLIDLLTGE